ncbi:MAG: J domain-containing protein [Deltaproteobacteria bacterium]|nr:J domain-containing protein [Nannocystaceae bacterium]
MRGDPPSDPAADRKRWYRTLELEPGAELADVRKAYRRLLKKFHPDRFANDPEKLKVATEVTRQLTEAHSGLNRYLGG